MRRLWIQRGPGGLGRIARVLALGTATVQCALAACPAPRERRRRRHPRVPDTAWDRPRRRGGHRGPSPRGSTMPDQAPRAQLCLGHSGIPLPSPGAEDSPAPHPVFPAETHPARRQAPQNRLVSREAGPPRGTARHPEPLGVCPRPGCLILFLRCVILGDRLL